MRFHPDPTGTAPLVTQIADDLAKMGDDVVVIASLPHYGRKDIHPDFRNHQGIFHVSDYRGVRVWRTPVYVPPRPTLYHRALNYLSYTFLSIIAGLRAGKADIIFAMNPPITTTFSAWIVSIFQRAAMVVGIQDIWPDCVILVGQLKGGLLIRLSFLMERVQYKIARRIIVLSDAMKDNLIQKNVPAKKIEVIPNWADLEFIRPLSKENIFRSRHGLQDKFVVLFAGNHGFNAALECVLDSASLLLSHPEILFLMVGEGNVKSDLLARAESEMLKNVRFLSTQPKELLPELLASADIGLVPLRKNLGDLNVPSKVYSIMAAARPVLASVPENSEIASLVRRTKCGILTPPEDPHALADALLDMVDRYAEVEKMGQEGRKYLLDNVTRQNQTQRYHRVLKSLVHEK